MLLALLLAATSQRVAVLELRNKLPDKATLDATYLTDLTRAALLKAAPQLDVMTRESVLVLIQAQGKTLEECEGECEVDTARRLGADLVVSGELLKFGSAYRVSLRMHDVKTARLLAASQASGATADELANTLPNAVGELAAAVGGRRVAAVEPPGQPWWKNVWLRNAGQVWAGYGMEVVGPTPMIGVRAFGLEAHFATGASFDETINTGGGSETHHGEWSGFGIGVSPISLSTSGYGDQSTVELTYFEPFAGYITGDATKVAGTHTVSGTVSGLELGTRAYLTIAMSRYLGLRFGVQAAWTNGGDEFRNLQVPGAISGNFGGAPVMLGVFGGLALTLGR